jgi:hypothetical protein
MIPAPAISTHRVGAVDFDPAELQAQNAIILGLPMVHIADGVGDYLLSHLWYGDGSDKRDTSTDVRQKLAYIDGLLERTFKPEYVSLVRIFAARRGGYIRPHRDFTGSVLPWNRVHIPLQTNDACLSSEDDVVYHMAVGEIWLFDGSRPHSGIALSEAMRLHVVIDFVADAPVPELFRDRRDYQPTPLRRAVERPAFTEDDLAAIHRLGELATEANFLRLADLLGTVHFEKHVSCVAMYDWLIEIGRRSGNPRLVERGEELKRIYVRAALAEVPVAAQLDKRWLHR